MAASCISVSLSASLVLGRSVEAIGARQTARHGVTAAPSVTCSSSCNYDRKLASFFSIGSRTARNDGGITSRAVELDEAEVLVDSEAEEGDSVESVDSDSAPAPTASNKLYVGNLPWNVQSKELAEIFQEHGNVELVEVIYDRDTQKSRGFAFVTMRTPEDAERAIDMLEGSELQGRFLKVNFPRSSKDGPRSFRNDRPPRRDSEGYGSKVAGGTNSTNKLFIGNLSWGVDDNALAELFNEYGKVLEAKVVHDRETGRSRGFAFATMSSANEVDMAIQALDGAEFDGRVLRVNHAGDKPERRDSPRREY